jgi:hypothetical protein
MNPWLVGQLVARRRTELEESARSGRRSVGGDAERVETPAASPLRKRASQRLGGVLISLGYRLAGPDGWPQALDA